MLANNRFSGRPEASLSLKIRTWSHVYRCIGARGPAFMTTYIQPAFSCVWLKRAASSELLETVGGESRSRKFSIFASYAGGFLAKRFNRVWEIFNDSPIVLTAGNNFWPIPLERQYLQLFQIVSYEYANYNWI